MADRIGSVAGLWRYPVKSMCGAKLDAALAGERGLAGDRGWAVVDVETGKVASAKRPKLWGKLLDCSAAYAEEPGDDGAAARVEITLPHGQEVMSDDPDRDRVLSEFVGRSVTLKDCAPEGASYDLSARDAEGLEADDPERLTQSQVGMLAPPGTFFDTSTIHLVAAETLAALAEAHPDGDWDPRRFRPNVLVGLDDALPGDRFAENEWVGHWLGLGEEARAAALAPMPRCVMTTVPQGDLPRDPLILRTLAERNKVKIEGYGVYACVGVLANVSAPGPVRLGDPVTIGDAP